MRTNNKMDMTIREQLGAIREEFCDKYCKFPEEAMSHIKEPDEAFEYMLENHCKDCPLSEL